jgi:Domain of unknown function (DUF4333)
MYENAAGPAQYPPGGWAPQPWTPPPPAPPRTGLVVAALVTSIVALGAVILLAGWLAVTGTLFPTGGSTLTGTLPRDPAGAELAGTDLAAAVTDRITEDGGDVSGMKCPDTPTVDQGIVSVCHGSISGDPWAVVVFFEDARGRFLLDPL